MTALKLSRSSRPSLSIVREGADEPRQLDDAQLVDGVRRKQARAERQLLERYGRHVERVLIRILGNSNQLDDLVQDVFARVFFRIGELNDATALKAFVTSVAVFVARERIRKKGRHRWLLFFREEEVPDVPIGEQDEEARDAVRSLYRLLDRLPVDERIAFVLRFVEGQELTEVAASTSTSLSTVKRRLRRAEQEFVTGCARDEALAGWLEGGARWNA